MLQKDRKCLKLRSDAFKYRETASKRQGKQTAFKLERKVLQTDKEKYLKMTENSFKIQRKCFKNTG